MSIFWDLLDGVLGTYENKNEQFKVMEVSTARYLTYSPVSRGDCLVLYKANNADPPNLEIVVQPKLSDSPNKKLLCIHRSENETDCQLLFNKICEKIPILVDCVPDLGVSKVALQNLLNVIHEYPTWNAAHIAAHFGYTDCFKNKTIASKINEPCESSLVTPLHVAIKALQISSVTALLALDSRLDFLDQKGNNVFHYAATTNKELIQALSATRCTVPFINMQNHDGHTPLHRACMAEKLECVKELLIAGADLNAACIREEEDTVDFAQAEKISPKNASNVIRANSQRLYANDMKIGGTPLHWSKTSELTEILIDHGCQIDAKNFEGNTALHMMVLRNRMPCVITLLSRGANVDVQGADGNTPLHLAAKSGDIHFLYTFIAFGANVNALNNRGETPRHIVATEKLKGYEEMLYALHLVGAQRCSRRSGFCKDGCEAGKHFNGVPPENPPALQKNGFLDELLESAKSTISSNLNKKSRCPHCSSGNSIGTLPQRCRVLCLDGGGIRGLVLIQMLDYLEKLMGIPLSTCFDWISGTSTGGFVALFLALGKTAKDCRCMYFRMKDKIFSGSRPYDSQPLENILKEELGCDSVMSDIKGTRVMLTATKSDRHPAELHLFRNYDSPLEIFNEMEVDTFTRKPLPKPNEQLIWEAARATGSAPTYFRAFGKFLDGGLISNNPTLDTMTEIHQCNEAYTATHQEEEVRKIDVILSLGTGKCPIASMENIDIFRPESITGAYKMALGVSAITQLLVDQATQADGRVVTRAQTMCRLLDIPYYRLSPQLTEEVGLDTSDNNTLVKMLWETTAYMHSMREELKGLCSLLRR